MNNLVSILLLGSLAVVPSMGIYGIKRMTLTPEKQFEQINLATRRINAESELMRRSSVRHTQRDISKLVEELIDFLDALGKSLRTHLDNGEARDFKVGGTVIASPRTVDNQAVPKKRCSDAYKKKCWRKPNCNLGQGIFGKCFTNAIKFAISFSFEVVNSMTFPDHPNCAVVMYPNKICSVVWKIEQKIMNFFFGTAEKEKKEKEKKEEEKKDVIASLAAGLSMALKAVVKLIESARDKQGDCANVPSQKIEMENGTKLECKDTCYVCGFVIMKPLPEIKVDEDEKNKKLNATMPIDLPGLSLEMDVNKPGSEKEKVVINIGTVHVNAKVSFTAGDSIKFDGADIEAVKYSGIELLGRDFDSLPEDKKEAVKAKLAEFVGEVLKEKWSSLGKEVSTSARKL